MRRAVRLALIVLWCLLALCLLVLWLRSRFRQDQFVYAPKGGRLWQLCSHSGEFAFSTATPWPNSECSQWFSIEDDGKFPLFGPHWIGGTSGLPWPGAQTDFDYLGVRMLSGSGRVPLNPDGTAAWERKPPLIAIYLVPFRGQPLTPTAPVRFVDVYVPFWLPAVLLGLFPARLALKQARRAQHRQRARENPGLCAACGYDLCATPHPGGALLDRCPECGRPTRSR